jgi:biotin-dependent carboxylase-like uncharacterized protein
VATVSVFDVLAPGIFTTVQDLGRHGVARLGVAPSGALDRCSARVANRLVGNPENAAVLEITLLGLKLRVLADVVVALTGADLQPVRGEEPLAMWCSHLLRAGDVLAVSWPQSGCRAYLAVGGGIDVAPVMGSRATNIGSAFGGLEGRALRAGDLVPGAPADRWLRFAGRCVPPRWIPRYGSSWKLRVIWGPQDEQFGPEAKTAFVSHPYSVSSESDRTGIRLQGAALASLPGVPDSIISEAILCGAIQVPGDGQPIVILGETASGGYRKIATVISADLPLLGQIAPGDTVTFEAVSLEAALAALREQDAWLRRVFDVLGA